MIALRSAWTIPACLMLAACGRGERPSTGTPGSGAPPAGSAEPAPPEAPASPDPSAGLPLRDPVQLTATADVDGAGAGETSEIATVKGSQVRGSGTGRIEPKGEGGMLIVDGQDAKGRAVHLTVDCSRFAEPVAEGG